MTKHVYILGAGFSMPLGGPSFTQLLTKELAIYLRQLAFEDDWSDILFEIHSGGLQHAIGRQLDAEQVLHKVDWMSRHAGSDLAKATYDALNRGASARRIGGFFRDLNRYLRQAVACQCEEFLNEVEQESDLWDPYVEWFKNLGPEDTIITFNYDTAVERVAEKTGRPFNLQKLCESNPAGMPMLIKLHGSADWVRNAVGLERIPAAYRNNYDVAIGIPGLTKATMHANGHFKALWSAAERAIIEAEQVSIIGYSMPATDNRARMMILNAIGAGRNPKQRICIVLGSDARKAERMLSIIRPVLAKQPQLTANTQMYAQDYIANVRAYTMADYKY